MSARTLADLPAPDPVTVRTLLAHLVPKAGDVDDESAA